jgi:Ser/Thr protein kinase RdoA (MazF antagonist)
VRPAGPWTATVHDLLRHVRAHGAAWAPEPRGIDAAGREVVGYVEGVVPAYPMPAWVWEDAVLDASAALLRELHDATRGFAREERSWQLAAHEPDEVICHNDFAPYNLAFRDGLPVAAIDFGAASPGPRAWDLAYLAYRLVPLAAPGNPDLPLLPGRERRLARLCGAYGDVTPEAVLELLPRRLEELAAFSEARGGEFAAHAALYRADARALSER